MNSLDKDLVLNYLSLAPIDDLVRFYEVYHHDYLYKRFTIETPTFRKEAYSDITPNFTEFLGDLFFGVVLFLKSKIKPHHLKYRDNNIYKMLYDIQHNNADPKTLVIQWDDKISFSIYEFFCYFLECEMNKSICSVESLADDLDSPYYIINVLGGISDEILENLKNSELLSYLSNQNFKVFVDAMMMKIIHNELEHFQSLVKRRGTFVDENGLGFYPYKFLYQERIEFQ